MKNKLYKRNTKKINSILNDLENKLSSNKYKKLYKLLKKLNLESFLFDFILLFDRMRNIKDFDFVYDNNKCYKFIYNYQLKECIQTSNKNISKKTNILVVLGLIEKLNVFKPEFSNNPIIKKSLSKSKKKYNRAVNFYHIPSYTKKLLSKANDTAATFLENKITLEKFDKSFVIKIFGQNFANEVFLDKRGNKIEFENYIITIKNLLLEELQNAEVIQFGIFKQKIIDSNIQGTSSGTSSLNIIISTAIDELIIKQVIIKRRLTPKEKELYNIDTQDLKTYILKGEKWNYENNN